MQAQSTSGRAARQPVSKAGALYGASRRRAGATIQAVSGGTRPVGANDDGHSGAPPELRDQLGAITTTITSDPPE